MYSHRVFCVVFCSGYKRVSDVTSENCNCSRDARAHEKDQAEEEEEPDEDELDSRPSPDRRFSFLVL